jgi:hypothetical protein
VSPQYSGANEAGSLKETSHDSSQRCNGPHHAQLDKALQAPQLQRDRLRHHDVRGIAERSGGSRTALMIFARLSRSASAWRDRQSASLLWARRSRSWPTVRCRRRASGSGLSTWTL